MDLPAARPQITTVKGSCFPETLPYPDRFEGYGSGIAHRARITLSRASETSTMTHRLLGAVLALPLAILIMIPVARPNAATRKPDNDVSGVQDIHLIPSTAVSAAQLADLRAKIQHIVFIVKENRSF